MSSSSDSPRRNSAVRSCTAAAHPERVAENAAAGEPPWFGPEERAYVLWLATAR